MIPDEVPPDESADAREEPDDPVAVATERIRTLGLRQQARVSGNLPWDMDADSERLQLDRRMVEERRAGAARMVGDLTRDVQDRENEVTMARAALLELEDRRTLRALLGPIEEHIAAAKWVDLADTVNRPFQGLLKSLTDAMKEATRAILNSTFESAFQRECQLLNCPSVRLEFPGRGAAPLRHKSVGANYRLGEVLSEGEQKVIALADFLAELSVRPSAAPVILDDPITSLDARRIDEVARRIVALSADQQVIVFTHHLYFATKLTSAFEHSPAARQQCNFYEVIAEDGKVGLVLRGSHPRMDTVAAFGGRVNATLQDARAASGALRADLIANAYGHIRGWIEAFVEDELLKSSVKRHRGNISIDALSRVNGEDFDDAVRILKPIYDRACDCVWPHAHTAEQLQARPTIEEVEAEWGALKRLLAAIRKSG